MTKINNEAKVRRSTRSVVLGKAKVLNYEDLEEAQAKHAAKKKAIADKGKDKGKRGRKRKSPALEADSSEPEAGLSVPKKKVARMSEQMSEVLEPAKTPITP